MIPRKLKLIVLFYYNYVVFKQHCLGHSLTFALGNHALCGQPIDLSLADN